MSYQVPHHIDNNKIFLVNRSEIEGRLEPEFYRPPIASLEKRIRSMSSHKLRDYALSIAGGATPKKTEADKYYSNAENGIPFLRVQNLQTNGELSLEDCIYINEETHNGLLKRSQVSEGDLLVKITGVGRMAIASVAPKGFVGNTNQHMVVIKTGDASISKYLARFLNLDIIEIIASRHSTGGTRPALDYSSLKALPIIESIDFTPIDKAIEIIKGKEREVNTLLSSIDSSLLQELGIALPKRKNGLKDRIFIVKRHFLEERIDPLFYYAEIDKVTHCTYSERLSNLAFSFVNGFAVGRQNQVEEGNGVLQIRPTNIDNNGRLKYNKNVFVPEMDGIPFLESGVVLFNNTNSQEWVGKTTYFANENNRKVYISNHITAITVDRNKILPEYLCAILNMYQRHNVFYSICTNWNNQSGIGLDLLKSLHIPLFTDDRQESLRRQQQIVDKINNIYNEADECIMSANRIMSEAKAKVESMIIGI